MKEDFSAYALLEWYRAMGVDEPVRPEPLNRKNAVSMKREGPESPPVFAEAPRPLPPLAQPLPETRVRATTLEELRKELDAFDSCPLKRTATTLVFADGNPDADIMIIGEAPGEQEDRQGLPFVGASGKLLDLMLASIGFDRTKVYISNIIPWRPPANRKPSNAEASMLAPFIKRHIELVDPKILLLLGGSAVSALLHTDSGISKVRGRVLNYRDGALDIPVIASFHPAFLLRSPLQKKMAWRDMLLLKKTINEIS